MKQLTLFEILAAIVPGALLTLGIACQYGYGTMIEKHGSVSIGELTILTLAALTIGMILQAPARGLKNLLDYMILPVRFTLYTSRPELLSPIQLERVKTILESRYGIPRGANGRDREQRAAIRMAYKEVFVALRVEGRSELFDRLTVYQAMYRGILCACLILLPFGIFAPIAGTPKLWMFVLLFGSIASIIVRIFQSERTRTMEMFLQLLVQESAGRTDTREPMLSVNSNER